MPDLWQYSGLTNEIAVIFSKFPHMFVHTLYELLMRCSSRCDIDLLCFPTIFGAFSQFIQAFLPWKTLLRLPKPHGHEKTTET